MKLAAIFLVFSVTVIPATSAQTVTPLEPFRLLLDIARFRGANDSSLTIEIHYAIAQGGMSYKSDSVGWRGAADVTLLVRGKDSLVYGDRWLVPHIVQDTSDIKGGRNLVGVYSLQLGTGEYTLTLIARDRNASARLDSIVLRLPVMPTVTDKLALSDIEFATSIRQGEVRSPFYKNTLEVIPNVGGLYGEDQKAFFYLEAYNLLLGDKKSDFTMRTAVFDAVGKEILGRERLRKRAGESAVLIDQFPVDNFKSGTYALVVSLLDSTGTAIAQSGRKFFVFNPKLGVDTTLLAASSNLPMPVYASMGESELDREFKWSRFESTDSERSQYEQLNGIDVKRKFLSDMWRRRPPGARESYLARVAHVNANYASIGREGYRTDRGRVFIQYGEPDDYERHPNESDMKPYEIWSFNDIQGGVIFVFVQRNQGGDYELVHSNHRNELHDENWQRIALSN